MLLEGYSVLVAVLDCHFKVFGNYGISATLDLKISKEAQTDLSSSRKACLLSANFSGE